jgi:ligand-binding sensor domain-containing protein
MKSRLNIFLSVVVLILLSPGIRAQYADWTQYTNGRHITATAMEGGLLWVGTTGGLVRVDTLTFDTQFFNTANSGLPSNDISAIAVDNQGNKWIGTKNKGLAVYDGASFLSFRQPVIGSDVVNAIAVENDTIWVGTNGGAAKFDQAGWSRYTRPNSLPSDTVTSIAFGLGVGWFGTAKGILEYENRQFFNQNANLPDQYITSVSVWPDTPLSPWVGMQNNGVAHYLGTAWNLYNTTNGLPSDQIQSVAVDVNGRVLAGTPEGLGFYDGNTWTTYDTGNSQIPANNVTTVQWWNISNKANIGTFALGGGGLATLSFTDNSWTSIPSSNSGLMGDVVNAVSVTQDGRIWAGSSGYLAYFNGSSWTNYTPADVGISQGGFSAMALDASGNPWIGSEGQGVFHYTGTQWINYNTPGTAGFPENSVHHIVLDGSGNVWIGTYGGVGKFDGTNWTTYASPTIPSNIIQALAAGSGTNVWISDVQTAGLVHYDGSTWTTVDASAIGVTPGSIQTVWISETGDPWIGTSSQGIATYTGGAWQSHTTTQNSSLPSDNVRSIQGDLNGSLWIGTSDGLAKLTRPNAFTNIYKSTDSGLPTSSIRSIAVGQNNLIYAATDSGLAVYSGFPFQGTPSLQIRPANLEYWNVLLGSADTLSFVLKNTGTADLFVTGLKIPSRFSFLENPILPDTIAPGDSVIGHIRFSPSQAAAYIDTMQITTNASTSPDNIIMTGTGVSAGAPNLQVRPASLAFGSVIVGNADTLSVVSKNTGASDLIIFGALYPTGFSYVGGSPTYPDTLAPGDSIQGSIRFAPIQAKAYQDTIKVFTNAPISPQNYIVTGTGVSSGINEPYLTIRNRMFGYDTLALGKSDTISTYLINTGSAPLTIDSLRFIVVAQGVYTLLSPTATLPITVPVRDSVQVSIRFSPSDVIFYGGAVRVVTNSPTSPDSLYVGGGGSSTQLNITGAVSHIHTGLYAFLSIPYVLGDKRISTVLSNLGPYDSKTWRLFYWKNNDYLEYPNFTPADSLFFKPGIAFWLIARDSVELNLQNVSATPATALIGGGPYAAISNYRITLQPGWNMIGNPFAYPIPWSKVLNTTSVQSPVVYNVAYNNYSYDQPTLEPWRGYFVYNRTSTTRVIQVPPLSTFVKASRSKSIEKDEFVLNVQGKGISSKMRTSQVAIGMLRSAEEGIDDEDYLEAPPIGNYIRLNIKDGKNLYAGNFKPISSAGAVWDFSLSTTGEKEKVEINLDEPAALPEGFKVFLLDLDRECTIPIQNGKADVGVDGLGKASRLRMIVGTEEYAKQESQNIPLVPYKFALKQNYPNPFNPETHIVYSLSQKSPVKLTIYNTLGQKVRTLFQGEQGTGAYPTTWDGTDDRGLIVNSGVYVCRLEAGQFAISKKMILIR